MLHAFINKYIGMYVKTVYYFVDFTAVKATWIRIYFIKLLTEKKSVSTAAGGDRDFFTVPFNRPSPIFSALSKLPFSDLSKLPLSHMTELLLVDELLLTTPASLLFDFILLLSLLFDFILLLLQDETLVLLLLLGEKITGECAGIAFC